MTYAIVGNGHFPSRLLNLPQRSHAQTNIYTLMIRELDSSSKQGVNLRGDKEVS